MCFRHIEGANSTNIDHDGGSIHYLLTYKRDENTINQCRLIQSSHIQGLIMHEGLDQFMYTLIELKKPLTKHKVNKLYFPHEIHVLSNPVSAYTNLSHSHIDSQGESLMKGSFTPTFIASLFYYFSTRAKANPTSTKIALKFRPETTL
jgi:hypothetical protein